jgi:uncharacterized protein YceK
VTAREMPTMYRKIVSFAAVLIRLAGCGSVRAQQARSQTEAEKYIIECSRNRAESVVTRDRSKRKDGSKGRYVGTDVRARRNRTWQIVAAQDAAAPVE